MPFGNSPAAILGLVAFELFAMHYVEVRRAYDLKNPGSVDQDPIFKNYRWSSHHLSSMASPARKLLLLQLLSGGVGHLNLLIGDLAHHLCQAYMAGPRRHWLCGGP